MGFVLPYTDNSLYVAEIFPILDAYPELSESFQNLLEERFKWDDDETWTVSLPEVGFEATLQSESVEFNFKNNLQVEAGWVEALDDFDLNWSIDSLKDLGFDFDSNIIDFDKISQKINLSFELVNFSVEAEVTTENDNGSMVDTVELSGEIVNGFPGVEFEWNHDTDDDLFNIAKQSLSLNIESSSSGDCDFSDNGMCNVEADMTIDYDGEKKFNSVHTLTLVTKPRIAWITYQIDDGEHFVVGARGENEDGKSAAFEDEGYVSVWYKVFDKKTTRPGKVANNKLGDHVVTFPLFTALEDNVWPIFEDAVEPFETMFESFGTEPKTIPNFIVYFDLWCEELLDEFGFGDVVEASRFSVWDMTNEEIKDVAEEIDMTLMESTFKNEKIPEFWEEARSYVQDLFGDEGQETFEATYLP